ncbi:NAD(P)-dependent oxidoreductase [soil metagenome]
MILVDRALEERQRAGNPIRVAMVGAGFMGRGIARQIITAAPGMELVAISNRHVESAAAAYQQAGVAELVQVKSVEELDKAMRSGCAAVTEDASLLCRAALDAIIEVTGAVEFGARVALEAVCNRKHVILMNAELDGTVGAILKTYADRYGVVYTSSDGDQPGVIMNLYRFVKGIGVRPVLCGNIKGLHDPYRNPTTQRTFAEQWGQSPSMVTSFADGTKISFEQAIVANATGMRVLRRGMMGPAVAPATPVEEAPGWYPADELVAGPGAVDYVVGASPNPGVFVLGTHHDPIQRHYLKLYKLGDGPIYCFYRPYHLCHFEAPSAVARAVDFGDAVMAPIGSPSVEVVTTAKTDLARGATLDGLGMYMTYGQCENADVTAREGLLPIGLAEGSTLTRDVAQDQVITVEDVSLPPGRLCDRLRAEQDALFQVAGAGR